MLYIWVLALHIEDFKLEEESINLVRLELRISPEKASKQLKDLGCDVAQSSSGKLGVKYTAELLQRETDPPLQLKDCFPVIGVNLKKRKRRTV